jgi:hypothetical protein
LCPLRTFYTVGGCLEQASSLFRLRQSLSEFPEPPLTQEERAMDDTMTIARSIEEGMFLLREGDCLWRVNEDGIIDCTAQGHTGVFNLLTCLQEWKTPSRRIFQEYPFQDFQTD